jgi:cysteine-rich repeat protein
VEPSSGTFRWLAATGTRASLLAGALMVASCSAAEAAYGNACAHGVCDHVNTAADTATAPTHTFQAGLAVSFSMASSSVDGLRARAYVQAAFEGAALLIDHASASYADATVLDSATPFASANLEFVLELTGDFSGGDHGPPCNGCGGESPWTSEGKVTAELQVYRGFDLVANPKIERNWHSNLGYLDENATEFEVELNVLQEGVVGFNRSLTVRSTAGNKPCLSGAGTCDVPGYANVDGNFEGTLVLKNFRLFDAESGAEIHDFRLIGSDGIDYVAIDRGCGNGVLDDGETCDDANYRAGDCCSPSCQIEVGECEDGDCGDADDDGESTVVDALAALRTAVGLSGCALCRCDANDSHDVSASDALSILKKAVGSVVPLRCVPCPA